MERMAKLKNTDTKTDDVIEFYENDYIQNIQQQPLNKQKEKITNKVIRTRFIITLIILLVIIVAMISYSYLHM